jgi:hypothetical protein
LLVDILIELLGGAAVDMLRGKKNRTPLPEGEVNASLGAVAAFLGGLSLLLVAIAVPFGFLSIAHGGGGPLALLLAGLAALLALGAMRLGTTALRGTQRNVALSYFARGSGALVLVAATVAFGLGLVGTVRWLL